MLDILFFWGGGGGGGWSAVNFTRSISNVYEGIFQRIIFCSLQRVKCSLESFSVSNYEVADILEYVVKILLGHVTDLINKP